MNRCPSKHAFLALGLLAATLLSGGCATSEGIQTNTPVSLAGVPVAGEAADLALDLYEDTVAHVASIAIEIVTAPFDAVESSLGMTPAEQRSVENLGGRFTYEERLARRRELGGMMAPPANRVSNRQTSLRQDLKDRRDAYYFGR